MLLLALTALMLGAPPAADAATAAGPISAPSKSELLALPSGDEDIRRALFQSHAQEPDRRVCTLQTLTGSKQPRRTCGTLREWFAKRTPDEIQAGEAPWQLVEEIKRQRRKVNARSRAG